MRAVLALVLLFLVLLAGPSSAQDRAKVVATIGTRAVTLGELEDRMAAVPPYQLKSFGDDAATVKRRFLDEVIVPEVLLSLAAEDKKLDKQIPTDHQVERARSSATLRALRRQIGPASSISMDEVKAYYEANKARFDAPDRIGIWRILTKTKAEAQEVLDAAKKDPTHETFTRLAREKSIDKATYLRGGNLGFISPDGQSNEPNLKVDAALYTAAASVKEGSFVPQPVQEGENFAVVWRRGTVGASKRSVEEAAGQIRDTLWRQKVEAAEKKLIDDLRAARVKDLNEELLQGIDISRSDGTIAPRKRPGQVAPR
jgi:peptidyl-prolyl cis-trans isomerase C